MITLKQIWISLTTPLSADPDAALRERMTRVIFLMVSVGLLLMSIIEQAQDQPDVGDIKRIDFE